MKFLNIELMNVYQTELEFEHWIAVTYQVPILKNEYTVNLLVIMDFEIKDKAVLEYIIKEWRYRDLVRHSCQMYIMENKEF
ncbi:hypothetical protein OJ598_03180 [Streptococcus anginosus]|uniref:DUF7720 family protein n=1 Tax=Streptococcus anginosus TaxID=1328 RepID=UPI0021F81F11|nr:hypothetical protein [Streptococcus anginosus]MCW0924656.1 hypothetical protein [Streptococcus anginosus]